MSKLVGPLEAVQALYAGKQVRKIADHNYGEHPWIYLNDAGDIVYLAEDGPASRGEVRVPFTFMADTKFEVSDRTLVEAGDHIVLGTRHFAVSVVKNVGTIYHVVAYNGAFGRLELSQFDLAYAICDGLIKVEKKRVSG